MIGGDFGLSGPRAVDESSVEVSASIFSLVKSRPRIASKSWQANVANPRLAPFATIERTEITHSYMIRPNRPTESLALCSLLLAITSAVTLVFKAAGREG